MKWEINDMNLKELKVNYPSLNGLLNGPPDLAHYSKGVKVDSWVRTVIF